MKAEALERIHCDEFHAGGPDGTSPYSPYYPRHFAQTDPDAHAKGFMIRTKDYKYISRINEADELYDLKQDPEERFNIISNPQYAPVLLDMKKKLRLWLMETADIVPFNYDKRFSEGMVWAEIKHLVPPEHLEEFREKVKKGINKFVIAAECQRRFGDYWNPDTE